jgi:hypothetical protein
MAEQQKLESLERKEMETHACIETGAGRKAFPVIGWLPTMPISIDLQTLSRSQKDGNS